MPRVVSSLYTHGSCTMHDACSGVSVACLFCATGFFAQQPAASGCQQAHRLGWDAPPARIVVASGSASSEARRWM